MWGLWKQESKRPPFPALRSRAKQPLDLIHSDLDKMPVLSIGRYKYTTTYLGNYSLFGVMFYLKHKNEEFATFKTYRAWAERQLGTTLKCRQFDQGGEFLSNHQLQTRIQGIPVLGHCPPMLQNIPWCEIQRNSISSKRNKVGTANSGAIEQPPNSWIRQWIWFIGTRPSQSSPTSHKVAYSPLEHIAHFRFVMIQCPVTWCYVQ